MPPAAGQGGGTLKRVSGKHVVMEVRGLEPGDETALREIARRSLARSYEGIMPQRVTEEAVDRWYGDDAMAAYRSGVDMLFRVAVGEEGPIGFAQSHVLEEINKGRILWIHVDPDHRGAGVGSTLLGDSMQQLHDRGIDAVTAVVLADHDAGIAFYEDHEFEPLAERTVTIGGEEYREVVMRQPGISYDPLEMRLTPDGDEVYIDFDEVERGSDGAFVTVYRGPRRERRWGWFCTVCDSFAANMDTMGRIQCQDCGNTRKPTRWDASYL